jgi:predicted dehydrogenase
MGTNHARVASTSRSMDLAYVVDADAGRAAAVAGAHGAEPATSVDDIAGDIDGAIIALPTELHAPVAVPLLERGVACLVEKPIARSIEDAERIVAAAAAADTIVSVGHVERFNPAVFELDNVIDDLVHLEADRISAFSPRVLDDVVLDLMIHDLDIVGSIMDAPLADVQAVGRSTRTDSWDLVTALLRFEDGVTAALTASRLGQQKIRELRLTQTDGFVVVDLLGQQVTINRVAHSEFIDERGARYRQTGVVEIPFLEHRGEPLAMEQEEFSTAVAERRAPRVSGEDGLRALRWARQVLEALER